MGCRILSLALLGAGIGGWLQPLNAAVSDWSNEWQAFRNAYPYHIQTVALSRPDGLGRRLMVISEPPPRVTLKDIVSVDPVNLVSIVTARHSIGFDGWVKDVLIELPPLGDSQLAALVDGLEEKLFGTAYKAVAVDIPSSPPQRATDYNFDLRVPASTLRRWLLPRETTGRGWFWPGVFVFLGLWGLKSFTSARRKRHVVALLSSGAFLILYFRPAAGPTPDEAMQFRPVVGGEPQTCGDLLLHHRAGVFVSVKPGLVLWTINRANPIDRYSREARQFSLDSDIILGGARVGEFIAIVGRERVAPVALLPPLRAETIMQLAAAQEQELSQSYERNHIFAGRFDNQDDWAPIYLSDTLIDTEYGSLLNITDQLLKSWSMGGQVQYINFKYPNPAKYPFPEPLPLYAKTHTVTFNWNTKGSGYSISSGDSDVFAWTRTGALPVDYLGGKDAKLHDAEDTGYEYFASRNDPNLVRVVQYAQLYQIFRHYNVKSNAPQGEAKAVTPSAFVDEARKVVTRFARADKSLLRIMLPEEAEDLIGCRDGFAAVRDELGQPGIDKLAQALAAPRLYERALAAKGVSLDDKNSDEAAVVKLAFHCQAFGMVLQQYADLKPDELRRAYVASIDRQTAGWVRTPSIVISRTYGAVQGWVGGHNLGAPITEFRASTEISPGKVQVLEENGKRILLHNPEDADKLQATVRSIARDEGGSAAEIERKAAAELSGAQNDARPMGDVLAFQGAHVPDAERGFQAGLASPSLRGSGWWVGDHSINPAQSRVVEALHSEHLHAIVVERTPDGHYMIFDGPSRRVIQANTQPAATDAVMAYIDPHGAARPVRLHLRGFEPREAKGLTQSAELQLAGFEEPPEMTATVEGSDIPPERLKAFLTEQYNFREVTIRDISEPFVTPEGEVGVHVDADIAAVKPEHPPLRVRITVMLKKGLQMTADMLSAIRLRITSAFASGEIRVTSDDTLLMTHAFVKSLEKISPDIGYVEVKVTNGSSHCPQS
jgi:hypothetical protein